MLELLKWQGHERASLAVQKANYAVKMYRNDYYCSERYHVRLNDEGIRLAGDAVSEEEWADPVANRTDLPIWMKGIDDCSYEEFEHALSVGVTAPAGIVQVRYERKNRHACCFYWL